MQDDTEIGQSEHDFTSSPPSSMGCSTCQSAWKPTRRDFIKATLATAVAAHILMSAQPAHALSVADCEDNWAGCVLTADEHWAYCRGNCPTKEEDPLQWMICTAACNGAREAAYVACNLALAACLAQIAAEEVARTIEDGLGYIAEHAVEIGMIIVIGGILFLVVACAVATDGFCLVAVGAAAA